MGLRDGLGYHRRPCSGCSRCASRKDVGKAKLDAREARLKKQYGLSREQYALMLKAQGGGCALCGSKKPGGPMPRRNFAVDHDHRSGKVRGLLCAPCNTGLGHFKDNQQLLRRAADYLGT